VAGSNFQVFEPTLWSPRVTEFFKDRLVLGRILLNVSDEVTEGGDTVVLPKIADVYSTASTIVQTTGVITPIKVDDTSTRLAIDTWIGKSVQFTDFQVAQIARQYNLRMHYAQSMAYGVARSFDSGLSTTLKQGLSRSVGISTDSLVATRIEKAFAILESNSVPRDQLSLVLHPTTYYRDLFNIAKYYDASQFGARTLPDGSIDMLYGVPLYRTANLGTTASAQAGYIIHPEAAVYAIGNLPGGSLSGVRISERQGENLRTIVIADLMYGKKILRSDAGIIIKSKV